MFDQTKSTQLYKAKNAFIFILFDGDVDTT